MTVLPTTFLPMTVVPTSVPPMTMLPMTVLTMTVLPMTFLPMTVLPMTGFSMSVVAFVDAETERDLPGLHLPEEHAEGNLLVLSRPRAHLLQHGRVSRRAHPSPS